MFCKGAGGVFGSGLASTRLTLRRDTITILRPLFSNEHADVRHAHWLPRAILPAQSCKPAGEGQPGEPAKIGRTIGAV
jgi:hypothetical protein